MPLLPWRREQAVLRFCELKAQALAGWHAPRWKGDTSSGRARGNLCWLCSRMGKAHLVHLRSGSLCVAPRPLAVVVSVTTAGCGKTQNHKIFVFVTGSLLQILGVQHRAVRVNSCVYSPA